LNFEPLLNILARASKGGVRPTLNPGFWTDILWSVIWQPLLSIIAIIFISTHRNSQLTSKHQLKICLIGILIPFIAFLSLFPLLHKQQTTYYILPVVSSLLVCLIPIFKYIAWQIYSYSPKYVSNAIKFCGIGLIFFMAVKVSALITIPSAQAIYSGYECQSQAEEVHERILGYLEKGWFVLGDMYVPLDSRIYPNQVAREPGNTWESLTKYVDAKVFVTNSRYYRRFLSKKPSAWVLSDNSHEVFKKKKEFYHALFGSKKFTDINDEIWILQLRTACGMEIWEKKNKEVSQMEAQQLLKEKENIFSDVLLYLDFSTSVTKGDRSYLVARSGQKVEVVGSARFVDGPWKGSRAIMVEGTSNPTQIIGPPSALNLKQGSLSVWAQLSDPKKKYSALVSVNKHSSIYIYRKHSKANFCLLYDGAPVGTGLTSTVVSTPTWHHYVFTWKEGEQKFYIDGREVLSGDARASTAITVDFAIGWLGNDRNTEQWHGPLTQFLTFDRALTAKEVATLYRWRAAANR